MVNQNLVAPNPLTSRSRLWPASFARPAAEPLNASVDVVTDPAEFAGMSAMWNETVDRAALHHPFLRHEWLHTWWQAFGDGRRLHILVVKKDGRVIALAPLMWETASMYGVQIRRLRLLQNDHTPDADVIIADESEIAYRAIWQSLVTMPEPWDVLLMSEVPRSSPTLRAFTVLATAYGLPTGLWQSDDSPYVSTTGTFDAYSATLSQTFRQNVRNRRARLAKYGEPQLEVIERPDEIRQACADAIRLEASGWKQKLGTSIESESETHRFYTELAGQAADAGWLRLLFLRVGDRRVATAYSAIFDNRLLYIKTGYDPEFAKGSPFKVLTHLVIRRAFETGLSEVDFLGTSEPWKLDWTGTTRPHDWLFLFGNTFRGRLVHQLKFRLKPALERFQNGIKQSTGGNRQPADGNLQTASGTRLPASGK